MGKIEITQKVKTDVARGVVKPTLAHSCELWTTNEREKSKMNSTLMRFPRRIKNKTRLYRIRNEVHGDELKVESMEVTTQRRQLGWLGHVARIGE